MDSIDLALMGAIGFLSGILAGVLGIGGGTILVPSIVALGYLPVQAVATSNLAIIMTATSGSIQNWRSGNLDLKKVLYLGFPSLITAQIGVFLANKLPPYLLLVGFGCLLLLNIYLIGLRKSLAARTSDSRELVAESQSRVNPAIARLATGGGAGVIAGLFGLGGGVIMVPLQMILLGENIKTAVQTSLGVIVITALVAGTSHALSGNVLFVQGICLGLGGLLGVQIGTRFLPKLPDRLVSLLFRCFMGLLAGYVFVQAWQKFTAN